MSFLISFADHFSSIEMKISVSGKGNQRCKERKKQKGDQKTKGEVKKEID